MLGLTVLGLEFRAGSFKLSQVRALGSCVQPNFCIFDFPKKVIVPDKGDEADGPARGMSQTTSKNGVQRW